MGGRETDIPAMNLEQARTYLDEQGFQPRREGLGWQIVYPKSGRTDMLTDEALCEKARAVKAYQALHPVLKSNPTIGNG